MRLPAVIITILGLLVSLSGCLQQFGGDTAYGDAYLSGLNPVAIYDPSYFEECKLGTCWCMACKNGTNIFGTMESIIGGYCYWEKNCNATIFKAIGTSDAVSPRQFMLGQGTTFSDFAAANTYCGDQLSMAVQWLTAVGTSPYPKPEPMRAMCLLSKNIFPVYMLYSGGNNIDVARAGAIGKILGTEGDDFFLGRLSDGPVGPVIIVVEPDADKGHAAQIAQAILAIDRECNPDRDSGNISCFLAVSPRFNDYEAMEAIMKQPGMDRSVDLIAYGINGSSAHSCEGSAIRMQALNFSKTALYNWSKPTLIPYVLFDVGTRDADDSCDWTEAQVAAAYGSFLPTSIQSLRASGVVGIAPYSFNITSSVPAINPLNCSNCGIAKSEARMKGWYGGCQAFAVKADATGKLQTSGGQTIMFSNASGGSCTANINDISSFGLSFRDHNIMQPQLTEMPLPTQKMFSCDACLVNNASPVTAFFKFDVENPLHITPVVCELLNGSEYSSVASVWASAREIDPTIIAAIILTEGGYDSDAVSFKPCAAARVCKANFDDGNCFQVGPGKDEGYDTSYDAMFDVTGTCSLDNAAPGTGNQGPNWRWAALGLMQTRVPPYTFWPASVSADGSDGPNYQYYTDALKRGLKLDDASLQHAKDCNPEFNPFNTGDSICIGTLTFREKLDAAHDWLETHHTYFNWPATNQDKDRVFETYIALNKYAGFWDSSTRSETYQGITVVEAWPGCSDASTLLNGDCWAQSFKESWQVTKAWCSDHANQDATNYDKKCKNNEPRQEPPFYCYGYTDFVEFVHDCHIKFLPRAKDPGAYKMSTYAEISKTCTTFCPEGNSLMELAGWEMPDSGTPYIPNQK